MRILLLVHSFNSLSQRLHVELRERGHEVSVEFDINDAVTREAVELFEPELILAPFLKRAIPEDVWRSRRCLIVHPGIVGDRGPSALDWAVLDGEAEWGVTVLEAEAEMDAGPIWASATFPMRAATKSSLYRREITNAAVEAVMTALTHVASCTFLPPRRDSKARGRARPLCRQADRAIDWKLDSTDAVLRKIRSADGAPGVRDVLFGRTIRLFDAHRAEGLSGNPGEIIARCDGALACATRDGAVWIGHVREERDKALKLPAADVFGEECAKLPAAPGYMPIRYEETGAVGMLHFAFYNGAMSVAQCEALRSAYVRALQRPTKVLLLMGGPDYWSNGIHLGLIEAAESPADESWRNISAIDDLARDIITTTDRIVVSVLRGSAGAGGVFLALAADEVWAGEDVLLNPHYKDMGNLYGSEYWTYLLPRRAGEENAHRVTQARLPVGVAEAHRLGLVDRVLPSASHDDVVQIAQSLAADATLEKRLARKREQRGADEAVKPLQAYRDEELACMRLNFYGFDPSYHVARYNFITKVPKSRTPLTLARHRSRRRHGG
ncbi:MAG: hydrogenase maturation protein [Alphaproteobacteria bacterium]|nr:hydrogenase maturation protein [Alphaproteobacteria bacterium]MDE2110509.1 hydrogenase maturation protein [Alphaproteobacteria bacterium]MDE2493259.1 hydrogenase maturation protein [Alphaproteobacteria bacterium]